MAGFAVFGGELSLDVFGVTRFTMDAARTVTHLTTRILKRWCFLLGSEAALLAISGGVAFETFFLFGFIESLLEAGQALKGMGLLVELFESAVLGGMAFLACI